jgi:peptidoglycan LD-endopeptidase LytH
MGPVRTRIVVCSLVIIVLAAVWLSLKYRAGQVEPVVVSSPTPASTFSPSQAASPDFSPSPLPSQSPSPFSSPDVAIPEETPGSTSAAAGASYAGTLNLIIPVAGVRPEQLIDTFADARSEGRVHDAIDIPAPADTPVLAAADGKILKLFQSERGGTTIYQLSPDNKLVFYYAHLARYSDGLGEGKQVRQGDVIAYVGDTGNAGPGNYHLHFSISVVTDPKRYWDGYNINPYPLLHR